MFPALAVIAGAACGVLLPGARPAASASLVLLIAATLLSWRTGRDRLLLASLLAAFVATGVVFGAVEADAAHRTPLRAFFDDYSSQGGGVWPLTIDGRLRADAMPTDYGASIALEVERVRTPCAWTPARGGVRLAVSGTLAAGLVDRWREGRRVRVPATLRLPASYRNPGVPDETLSLARRGIGLVGSVKSGTLVEVIEPGSLMQEGASAARAYVRRTIMSAMPDRPLAAAIVTAILVGDRGGLDPSSARRLQEAGTYHVIAISGGNIAILAGLTFLLLRLARVPVRPGALTLAGLLCAYGYVAGGGPSVARATLAAVVYLLAIAADHRSPAANVLAAVALIAVVYEPLAIFDPGLALSYGATVALLVGAERVWSGRGSEGAESAEHAGAARIGLLGRLRLLCATAFSASRGIFLGTICAELALFPIGASVFHRVTLAGLLLNFAAIPLMTIAQVSGLVVLVLAPLSTSLAGVVGQLAAWAATGLTESARLLDLAPWLAWRVPSPLPAWIAAYYAGWIVWLWAPVRPIAQRGALAASACAALVIGIPVLSHHARPGGAGSRELRVTFLDVGQGDAVLVQLPGGRSLLIDAAGLPGSAFDLGERVITPALLASGVRTLEYFVITHGDPDHVAGASSVARDFRPRELWEGVAVPRHALLKELQAIVSRPGGAVRTVRPGDRVRLGDVELRVLHPPEPEWERQRVRNDDSVVLELRYGDVSIVLPGDIGAAVEETLAPTLSDAPLRVLKAAHHGSASSSGASWLAAARAAAVIFSCGRGNRYGHPHPSVLARVRATGARIFRTDEDGAITVTTDGTDVTVRTFTGRVSRITTKVTKGTKETTNNDGQPITR